MIPQFLKKQIASYTFFGLFSVSTSAKTCAGSGHAVVDVCQQLPVAIGRVRGMTLGALQKAFVQEAGDFRRRSRVVDGETLELQPVVGAGLREAGVGRFLKNT